MEFDSDDKPYLRLPPPNTSITLTAYRPDDAPILISMLNHPAVYMNLAGPPFPYLQTHHNSKVEQLEVDQRTAVKEFREFVKQRGKQRKWVGTVPFTVIRENTGVCEGGGDNGEREEGQGTAIGDLVFRRSDFYDINDEKEREVTKARNDALEPGNPDIVWEIGCKCCSSLHSFFLLSPQTHVSDILHRFQSVWFPQSMDAGL